MRIRKTLGDDGIVAIPWRKTSETTEIQPWKRMLETGWGSVDDGGENMFAMQTMDVQETPSTRDRGGPKISQKVPFIPSEALRWTIWDRCYNNHCENCRLYERRKGYLDN
jgi:hypothetical protein